MSKKLKHYLEKAELYGLLARKYEYVDPARHIHFYRKHFHYVQKVNQEYMRMHGESPHYDMGGMGMEMEGMYGAYGMNGMDSMNRMNEMYGANVMESPSS